jgi:hypothetical protein
MALCGLAVATYRHCSEIARHPVESAFRKVARSLVMTHFLVSDCRWQLFHIGDETARKLSRALVRGPSGVRFGGTPFDFAHDGISERACLDNVVDLVCLHSANGLLRDYLAFPL